MGNKNINLIGFHKEVVMKRGKQLVVGIMALLTLIAFAGDAKADKSVTVKAREVMERIKESIYVDNFTRHAEGRLHTFDINLDLGNPKPFETLEYNGNEGGPKDYDLETLNGLLGYFKYKGQTMKIALYKTAQQSFSEGADIKCKPFYIKKSLSSSFVTLMECEIRTTAEFRDNKPLQIMIRMDYRAKRSNRRYMYAKHNGTSKKPVETIVASKFVSNPFWEVAPASHSVDPLRCEGAFDDGEHRIHMGNSNEKLVTFELVLDKETVDECYKKNRNNAWFAVMAKNNFKTMKSCKRVNKSNSTTSIACTFDFSNDQDLYRSIKAKRWENNNENGKGITIAAIDAISDKLRPVSLDPDHTKILLDEESATDTDTIDDEELTTVTGAVSTRKLIPASAWLEFEDEEIEDEDLEFEDEDLEFEDEDLEFEDEDLEKLDVLNNIDEIDEIDNNNIDGLEFGGSGCSMLTSKATSTSSLFFMIAALTALVAIKQEKNV
jgi:hypothetical protein